MDGEKTLANREAVDLAIRRFLAAKRREDVSAETLDWYKRRLGRIEGALGGEYVDEWTRERINDFLDELADQGRSRDYIRGFHQILRTFVAFCREEGWAVSPDLIRPNALGNKWFTIKKPKAPESPVTEYTQDEVTQILEVAESPRNRAIVQLYLGTGLRLSELIGLRIDDVNFETKAIMVRRGKGRKPRVVFMTEGAARACMNYYKRHRPDTDCPYFFTSVGGSKGLSKWAISAIFTRMNKRLPFRLHAHALRHTFATRYAREVGDSSRLQMILGHASPKMTQRYIHLAGADLAEGFDKLGDF